MLTKKRAQKEVARVYYFYDGIPHQRIHLSCVPVGIRNSGGLTVAHPVNSRQMEMAAIFGSVYNGIATKAASINHPEICVLSFW